MNKRQKVKSIQAWTDENGFYCDFLIPRAALMSDHAELDNFSMKQLDLVEDTMDMLVELACINEN